MTVVEYRALGQCGLQVSTLTMGTMTFGGKGNFANVGSTDVDEARHQVAMCLDAGINLIDTADVYSDGGSEEILGEVLAGRRDDVLLATKVRFPTGPGPNDAGLSRHHSSAAARRACAGSAPTTSTSIRCTSGTGRPRSRRPSMRWICWYGTARSATSASSNFAGWQLMKALGTAERHGLPRFVSEQIYYSLQARDAEYELIPAAVDQGLGVLVWSPLAGGLLSGKYRRGRDAPAGSRQLTDWDEPPVYDQDKLYDTVEVLVAVGEARGVSAAQVALAWLLGRPAVTSCRDRRPDRRAARRQPGGRRPDPHRRRAAPARRGQRPAAAVPVLASGEAAGDRLSPADLTLLGPHL